MTTLENRSYTFNALMDGRQFVLPEYQRYFAWEKDHFEDLWNDLMHARERDETYSHFMGQLICRDHGTVPHQNGEPVQRYALIDGQQRLTTLAILVNCITDRIGDDTTDLRTQYVQDPGIADDTIQKIRLQQGGINDNRVLRAILDGQDTVETRTRSEQRLVDARSVFVDRLDDAIKAYGSDVLEHILALVEQLQFMVYNVTSEEKAALIYETINDRGKQLTNLEKTKSFLMHQTALCTDDDETREDRIRQIRTHFSGIYIALQDIHNADLADELDNLVVDEDTIQQHHFVSHVDEDTYTQYMDEIDGEKSRTAAAGAYLDILKWQLRQLQNDPATAWAEIQSYSQCLEDFFRTYRHLLVEHDDPLSANLADIFDLGTPTTVLPLMVRSHQQDMDAEQAQNLLKTVQLYMLSSHGLGNKRLTASSDRFYELAYQLHSGECSIDEVIERVK